MMYHEFFYLAVPYLNLPDGYQHDPRPMQSPDQAGLVGLIYNDIGDRSHLTEGWIGFRIF
jgi:hypothetical protein